jgi:hypothetical protein
VRRSLREKTQCTSLNFSDLTQLIGIGSACLEEERNPSAEPKEGKTNGTSREKPRLQQSANIFIISDGGLLWLNVFYLSLLSVRPRSPICTNMRQNMRFDTLPKATLLFFCPHPVERDEKSGLIRQQALWALTCCSSRHHHRRCIPPVH